MNIKILDSWLREYLNTKATVDEFRRALSLCSVSVERIEKIPNDIIYDIEVTTNRPDLMSVIGIAREAAVVLPHFGIPATFHPLKTSPLKSVGRKADIDIKNDPKLVNRVLAIVMEVQIGDSPETMQKRLETTDIRSLNNIIDITNYVMRETGHPAHVFDYDRLISTKSGEAKQIIIRTAKPGEQVTTLDKKTYTLAGGDIVADNGTGEIIDLLGVMGTENSVVTNHTSRILFFLNNNNPHIIRKTSMNLGIRTEAAVLNEKGVDPETMEKAFLRGVELYKEIANGKIISDVIDIYPNKPKTISVSADTHTIRSIIGVDISDAKIKKILTDLEFTPIQKESKISVTVPSFRLGDVANEEDIIEEVARVYGYHNIPSILPPLQTSAVYHQATDPFYWERRIKSAFKYWGFTETYTYSMVSADMLEGPVIDVLTLKNPLDEDHAYMRQSLIPSMLEVIRDNADRDEAKIFEISNVYFKNGKNLPQEIPHLAAIIKKENVSFYEMKGIIEQIGTDIGVLITFAPTDAVNGAAIRVGQKQIGVIEILDTNLIDFELDFTELIKHATTTKQYVPIIKYPPIIEDVSLQVSPTISYAEIVATISKQSKLIKEVSLLDMYEGKRTFRIIYQHAQRNLTNEDISEIRKKISNALEKELKAKVV